MIHTNDWSATNSYVHDILELKISEKIPDRELIFMIKSIDMTSDPDIYISTKNKYPID